jgi:hypothetical protein
MKFPPNDPKDFARWLHIKDACCEALRWQHGKTLRDTWESCKRGDWLIWLLSHSGYKWTDAARAEYLRVATVARADEYLRVTDSALAEYLRVTTVESDDEYQRVKVPAMASYRRAKTEAWASYQRSKADILRTLIPYPFEGSSRCRGKKGVL